MNINYLEEQVACVEERALHLSLVGDAWLGEDELVEAQQNLNTLETETFSHNCRRGHALRMRIASVRSELEVIRHLRASRGKAGLSPVAA